MFNTREIAEVRGEVVTHSVQFQCVDCKQFFDWDKLDKLSNPEAKRPKNKIILWCFSCMDS